MRRCDADDTAGEEKRSLRRRDAPVAALEAHTAVASRSVLLWPASQSTIQQTAAALQTIPWILFGAAGILMLGAGLGVVIGRRGHRPTPS